VSAVLPGTFASFGPSSAPNLTQCTTNPKDYINGHTAGISFVPDFISKLPTDPKFKDDDNKGFYYKTDTNGTAYKILVLDSVETLTVSLGDEFARCPTTSGACSGSIPANTYSVYSAGAENW